MSARPKLNTARDYLASGDIEGLLAFHRSIFGSAVMTSPPPATDPNAAPPANPQGVWGQGVVPPAIPGPIPAGGFSQGQVYDAAALTAAVEAARREERDKLHQRLSTVDTLQTTVTELQQKEAERAQAIADAEAARVKAETEAAEAARLADMSAIQRVEEMQTQFQQQLAEERAQRERDRAVFLQEQAFRDLSDYRTGQIAANQDRIAPEFLDYIQGTTQAEIDASIATAIEKTDSIVAGTTAAQRFGMTQVRGVAPTGLPPVGGPPDTSSQQTTLSAAEIAAMGPAEYAKNRQQLLAATSRQVQEQGLYGQR